MTIDRNVIGGISIDAAYRNEKENIQSMIRKTTTKQINDVLSNNLLLLKKAEVYHKTTRKTEVIDTGTLIEDLEFFCESGVFVDCVGWTFERDCKTNSYIAECSRTDGNAENIIILYLGVGEGTNVETINEALAVEEEMEE